MDINSAFSSGVAGFHSASRQISESSERIANQPLTIDNTSTPQPEGESVTAELVNMKVAELQAKASAKVITTADEMVGTLIDVTV